MKTLRTVVVFLCVFCLLIPKSFAQDEGKNFRFDIKTNPLAALGGPFWITIVPITGEYKLLFEAATTKKQSVQLGASYLGPSVLINIEELTQQDDTLGGVNIAGFRATLTYKFFLTRGTSAPEGFYVGPYFSYASMKMENEDQPEDNVTGKKITYDAVLGYQLITNGGFTLDIFTGFGLRTVKWDYKQDEAGTSFDIWDSKNAGHVAFGMSFGIAF